MQSTTTVVCRALVMVVCLVTIPLVALFGTSLLDLIKTFGWGESSVSAREQGGMAPAYSPNIPDAAGLPDSLSPGMRVADASREEMFAGPSDAPRLPDDMRTVQASFNESATATAPPTVQPSEARFEQIQQRLRGLGATYFCLESFGTSRQLYRFHCKMPLGTHPAGGAAYAGGPAAVQNAVRHFESTSENSLQAMENVLAEIEAWLRPR